MHPALATANPFQDISVSPGVSQLSTSSGERGPWVTTAYAGRIQYTWRHKPFAALDEQAFMDAIEPPPLFLQPGYKFARRVS